MKRVALSAVLRVALAAGEPHDPMAAGARGPVPSPPANLTKCGRLASVGSAALDRRPCRRQRIERGLMSRKSKGA